MLIFRCFPWEFYFISFFIVYLKCCNSSVLKRNDFGGEFSGTSVSGSDAPGPTANTMGNKAASAMAIGTGTAGAGDYTSNYKTPNYTQYTSQDFKEYMPDYKELMESSMDKMSGMSGGGNSSMGLATFSGVGSMLKAFMDLQKEQLAVEKAKADANKAKVDLAINYDDDADESETEKEVEYRDNSHRRKKRSLLTLLSPANSIIPNPFGGSPIAKQPISRPMMLPPMPSTPMAGTPMSGSPMSGTLMTTPSVRPSEMINKGIGSEKIDISLTNEEKASLKKIMGLLEVPQVKGLLNTMSSLASESNKTTKRKFRQAAPQPSSGSPPPSSQSPSTPPPQQSSQSTQQSDKDWKQYLSSPTSSSPTASGSEGDWSKYMGSGTTGGSWGGKTKKDTNSWTSDDSKSKDWSKGDWSSSSPSSGGSWPSSSTSSSGGSWSPDSSSSSAQSWPSSSPPSGPPSSQPPPPQGSFDWAKGNGGGSTGSNGLASGASQRQVRSSFVDPSMSPVHGSMSLMNLPMYSPPTPNNIPNLSFSLNPTSSEADKVDEDVSDDIDENTTENKPQFVYALPQQSSSLLMQSPSLSSYSPSPVMMLMQPSPYSVQTSGPLMSAPQPIMPSSSPFIYSQPPVLQQSVSDPFIARELGLSEASIEPLHPSSSLPVMYNGPKPMFYNTPSPKFYNTPKMFSPSGEVYETAPSSQPLLMTNEPKPLQLYRLGRSEPIMDDKSPISVYKVSKNDATGIDEIKKLIIDIDKGIIVSQSDRSEEELTEITTKKRLSKRSLFGSDEDFDDVDDSKELEDFPFVRVPFFKGSEKLLKMNHHIEDEPDRQRRPTLTTSESSNSAPSPTSKTSSTEPSSTTNDTTVTINSKESRSSSIGYQYQASGTDTDYDYAETPQIDEGPETQDESRVVKREVKIGFDQKGDLPPGSSETVSAGGGRSPGHHEGGGLTVKIKIPPKGRFLIDTSP
ncbi:uncharacterized protein [Lepeophtheirus salmonis]|uniref:uncharacterized protein isoform X3 n=1 Tax=Lepeophtheirus salmonis TaxID=72036 RepID=UPI001AE9C657|nr:A-agglutinin anchorage subunit-like isoform X3 [Lepeophtheirus salmonis]